MNSATEGDSKRSNNHRSKLSANDFIFGKLIGEGSFSVVYLAKDVSTSKVYAAKVCEKVQIIRERKQEYVKREREALNKLSGLPGFLNLYCTFQDSTKLFFIMTYAKNGTLLQLLEKAKTFDSKCTRFYSAEILHAIEQMHDNNIIHRDLKPENILLDDKFHTMMADFGSSRIDDPELDSSSSDESEEKEESGTDADDLRSHERQLRHRRGSFVGTAQYVSPEILKGRRSTKSSDLWSFGCIIYQMIVGFPPFRGPNDYLIFQKITKLDLAFPDNFDPVAKDIITKLLVLDPNKRLGSTDNSPYASIRSHPFFADIDVSTIRLTDPPIPTIFKSDVPTKEEEVFPEDTKPGLDASDISRLLGIKLGVESDMSSSSTVVSSLLKISETEKLLRLEKQKSGIWHQFTDGELILKQGFVNKRKGTLYVPRRRMLLLTSGPRLIYIDPVQMVKKGEIPWSKELHVETKTFKIFLVHTPHRTYYLEDPQGFALKWHQAIQETYDAVYRK